MLIFHTAEANTWNIMQIGNIALNQENNKQTCWVKKYISFILTYTFDKMICKSQVRRR